MDVQKYTYTYGCSSDEVLGRAKSPQENNHLGRLHNSFTAQRKGFHGKFIAPLKKGPIRRRISSFGSAQLTSTFPANLDSFPPLSRALPTPSQQARTDESGYASVTSLELTTSPPSRPRPTKPRQSSLLLKHSFKEDSSPKNECLDAFTSATNDISKADTYASVDDLMAHQHHLHCEIYENPNELMHRSVPDIHQCSGTLNECSGGHKSQPPGSRLSVSASDTSASRTSLDVPGWMRTHSTSDIYTTIGLSTMGLPFSISADNIYERPKTELYAKSWMEIPDCLSCPNSYKRPTFDISVGDPMPEIYERPTVDVSNSGPVPECYERTRAKDEGSLSRLEIYNQPTVVHNNDAEMRIYKRPRTESCGSCRGSEIYGKPRPGLSPCKPNSLPVMAPYSPPEPCSPRPVRWQSNSTENSEDAAYSSLKQDKRLASVNGSNYSRLCRRRNAGIRRMHKSLSDSENDPYASLASIPKKLKVYSAVTDALAEVSISGTENENKPNEEANDNGLKMTTLTEGKSSSQDDHLGTSSSKLKRDPKGYTLIDHSARKMKIKSACSMGDLTKLVTSSLGREEAFPTMWSKGIMTAMSSTELWMNTKVCCSSKPGQFLIKSGSAGALQSCCLPLSFQDADYSSSPEQKPKLPPKAYCNSSLSSDSESGSYLSHNSGSLSLSSRPLYLDDEPLEMASPLVSLSVLPSQAPPVPSLSRKKGLTMTRSAPLVSIVEKNKISSSVWGDCSSTSTSDDHSSPIKQGKKISPGHTSSSKAGTDDDYLGLCVKEKSPRKSFSVSTWGRKQQYSLNMFNDRESGILPSYSPQDNGDKGKLRKKFFKRPGKRPPLDEIHKISATGPAGLWL